MGDECADCIGQICCDQVNRQGAGPDHPHHVKGEGDEKQKESRDRPYRASVAEYAAAAPLPILDLSLDRG
jgi:hypothetical protein